MRFIHYQVRVGGPVVESISPAILFVAAPAFLILLSHCISTMLRARTAWLILDFVGCVAVGVAGWLVLRPFVDYGFYRAAFSLGWCLFAGLILALLAATAAGVANGRTGIPRTHRFVSLVLWISCVGAIGFTASYASWLEHFEPADLVAFSLNDVSSDGRWAEVEGYAPGHKDVIGTFLVAATGDRHFKLPLGARTFRRSWKSTTSVSGTFAVWGQRLGRDDTYTVCYANLEGSAIKPVATMITAPGNADVRISPRGRSVAIRLEQILSIYDVATGNQLTVVPIHEESYSCRWQYNRPDTIRLVERGSSQGEDGKDFETITVVDVAVAKGARPVTRTFFEIPPQGEGFLSPNLHYLAIETLEAEEGPSQPSAQYTIYDADSGEVVTSGCGYFGGFLPTNEYWSISALEPDGSQISVELFQADGKTTKLELEGWPNHILLGRLQTGDIVLATDYRGDFGHWYGTPWESIEVIDPGSLKRHTIDQELSIAGTDLERRIHREDQIRFIWGAENPVVVFRDAEGTILSWDSEQNRLVPIAGHGLG